MYTESEVWPGLKLDVEFEQVPHAAAMPGNPIYKAIATRKFRRNLFILFIVTPFGSHRPTTMVGLT